MELLTNIFDSHAHYNDRAFSEDLPQLMDSITANGVRAVLNVSWDVSSAKDCISLSEQYPFMYAACGVHPSDAGRVEEDYLSQLRTLAQHERVVAIGEIGLDYHYDDSCPHDIQKEVFEQQLQLAQELDLPVIIHSREATEDTMILLRKYRPRGVVHCFSGSAETAREIIALGMYVGFTGVLTFSNAKRAKKAVEATPLDRLLLETDCPYMAPVPYRGKRCDSGMLSETAAVMAGLKQIPIQQMIDLATENTCRLFSITLP